MVVASVTVLVINPSDVARSGAVWMAGIWQEASIAEPVAVRIADCHRITGRVSAGVADSVAVRIAGCHWQEASVAESVTVRVAHRYYVAGSVAVRIAGQWQEASIAESDAHRNAD